MSECPPLSLGSDSGPALSPGAVGAQRRRDADGMDGWRVEEAEDSSLVSPPPAHFVTVARWGGSSWIDSSGSPQSCGIRASVDGRVLSRHGAGCRPGGPRHPSALWDLGLCPLGFVQRRRCRSGWGRLWGWTPARGASGNGLRGRGGARESPPSGSLFSRETFPPPTLCKAPASRTRCPRSPQCVPLGRNPSARDFRWGGPSGHRRQRTVSCL